MARKIIDHTGNDNFTTEAGKLNDMLAELYAGGGSVTLPVSVAQGGTASTTAAAARTALAVAASGINSDITSLTGLSTPLSIAQGGTNAVTAAAARTALAVAASGANADITSLSALSTPLSVAQGGTNAVTAGAALTALGAAASGANADITQLTGLASTLTGTSGTVRSNLNLTTVTPSASSTALYEGIDIQMTYSAGANAITGAGHMIPFVGELFNNNTAQTLPLCVGGETTLDTLAGTTITTSYGFVSKVRSNAGTITSAYNYQGSIVNSGTITIGSGYTLQITNTGSITSYVGYWVPNITGGTISSSFTGLRFENQTTSIGGAKHCILCLDAGADINTIGPIITTGLTTTATFQLDTGTKTVTASAGAATLNKSGGIVTTEALTTVAGSDYTLTLTNSQIAAGDQAFVSIDSNGTAGLPFAYSVKTTANTLTVIVRNIHASAAFNAAIKIAYAIHKN